MTDDMLRAVAKNGGVVMINYHAAFLSEEFRVASEKKSRQRRRVAMAAMSKKCGGNEACTTMESERIDHEAMAKGTLPKVTWEKIVEHIDHAVKVRAPTTSASARISTARRCRSGWRTRRSCRRSPTR